MATTTELAQAIGTLVATTAQVVPITLMNHNVDEAAEIIAAVAERCSAVGMTLTRIFVDPELGSELGLKDGTRLTHAGRPVVVYEPGLARQLRFEKADTA